MQEPIFLQNEHTFNNASMGDDLVSDPIDLGEAIGYAIHFIWTGSPVGFVTTSGSNDPAVLDGSDNFVPVDTQATGGVAGQHLLNVEHIHYKYIRISFTSTSGTGVLNAFVSAKRG